MTEYWYERKVPGDYRKLSQELGISPVTARVLANRSVIDPSSPDSDERRRSLRRYLEGDPEVMYNYRGLPDIDVCTDILAEKIKEGAHIRVIGDYDIDGVCSTYILTKGLHKCGAHVDHGIPDRIRDGYGLNDRLIREAHEAGVDTVITCDNGIAAMSQIDLAKELGMTVIVTDHHEVPYHMLGEDRVEDIPHADAVVDIKRNDSGYGFTEICGAVVAFKVMAALCEKMGMDRSLLDEFIEFAGFATIGDVMPIINENRDYVVCGLERLGHTANPGMKALIRAQGLEGKAIKPYHVGFVLGPCINATGRLASAEQAYELLAAEDEGEASRLSELLVAMNRERRAMTDRGLERALQQAEGPKMERDRVLVIYLPDTHESVAGIIAGKVREKTGKPAFVLTDGAEGIKGSSRSIDEYDMHVEMSGVRDLFEKFGGHKMAGGLTLKEGVTPDMLRERLNDRCTLTEQDLAAKIRFDMELPFSYVTMDLVQELGKLEPFGMGHPKPLFAAKDVELRNIGIFGDNRNVLKCRVYDSYGGSLDAVYFGDAESLRFFANDHGKIKLLFCPDINEYRGNVTVQLKIEHYSA